MVSRSTRGQPLVVLETTRCRKQPLTIHTLLTTHRSCRNLGRTKNNTSILLKLTTLPTTKQRLTTMRIIICRRDNRRREDATIKTCTSTRRRSQRLVSKVGTRRSKWMKRSCNNRQGKKKRGLREKKLLTTTMTNTPTTVHLTWVRRSTSISTGSTPLATKRKKKS